MKTLSLVKSIFIITLLALIASCSGQKESAEQEGKVLNIACWNNEFKERLDKYFVSKGLLPEGVRINWIQVANENNMYQNMLDELLVRQKDLPADEKLDLFLVEADYALKYVNTPYTLDVRNAIGLTDDDLRNQYTYTKDIMTDQHGILKGVSWQACPGGFIYRRSIAKDVLGTDDTETVESAMATWKLFDETAKKAKEKGYFMLSGYDDAFRVFSANVSFPLVQDGRIVIGKPILDWIKQTKEYTDNGYNNKANLWSEESKKGAGPEGKVFGYFAPAWFMDYTLVNASLQFPNGPKENGNGTYGDWAICKGPQGFFWGGTWICAVTGTDNKKLIHDIMYTLTCKKDTMEAIAEESGDFTNNIEAMEDLARSNYKNSFLGGQNHIRPYLENALSIRMDSASPYDQGIYEKLQQCFAPYFEGYMTEKQAWDYFYREIEALYPQLSH